MIDDRRSDAPAARRIQNSSDTIQPQVAPHSPDAAISPPPPAPITQVRRASRRALLMLAALCGLSGCVQIYQPMSGLHRPVVVDPQAANLVGLRVVVHCLPGELLSIQDANVLCRNVGLLLSNQGADAHTFATARALGASDTLDGEGEEAEGAELIVELRSRLVHESNDPILWTLCYLTFTIIPAVTESTFAQDITIRDGEGFLLVTDTLQGRIVRRFGVTSWVGNKALDLIWRDEEDRLTGDAASRDLSSDLYRQLSQLVFNARMQREVLLSTTPEVPSWD